MNFRYHEEATDEVRVAANFYDQKVEGLGLEFVEALAACLDGIGARPTLFPRVAGSGSHRDIRQSTVDRFPFVVVYEIVGDEVVILAVAHHAQKPGYWKRRKP